MPNVKALAAEFIGTFWLVLGGCGAAVLASAFIAPGSDPTDPFVGIGFLGVSFAFGLTVLTGVYALGHISGGHFNPAVTLGLVAAGRAKPGIAIGYIIMQVLGGILGAAVLFAVASGQPNWDPGTFASNGYDEWSPGGFNLGASFLIEVVMTAMFLVVIMGATAKAASPRTAGLAIGLALTLIHLISIPVTNTSVNPARSTSQAIFAGSDQLAQLWLFWVAPILGGVLGALIYRFVVSAREDVEPEPEAEPAPA
jgi:aquaporin Z